MPSAGYHCLKRLIKQGFVTPMATKCEYYYLWKLFEDQNFAISPNLWGITSTQIDAHTFKRWLAFFWRLILYKQSRYWRVLLITPLSLLYQRLPSLTHSHTVSIYRHHIDCSAIHTKTRALRVIYGPGAERVHPSMSHHTMPSCREQVAVLVFYVLLL